MQVFVVYFDPRSKRELDQNIGTEYIHCIYQSEIDAKRFINSAGSDYYYTAHEVI